MKSLPSNYLLSSLSGSAIQRIIPSLKLISLPSRTPLYYADESPEHAYFLVSGLASIVTTVADGSSAEVAMIGREGLVGASHLLGPATEPANCFMQADGEGWQIPLTELQVLFDEIVELRYRICEFAQFYSFNLTQVACCNRLHDSDVRLARWLAMAQDRLQMDSLPFTHDVLAVLLGTSRPTVTVFTGKLQQSGIIQSVRGSLMILDSVRLKANACECLVSIQKRVDGLYRI
jgi:CRP-like cAMP-binding protein